MYRMGWLQMVQVQTVPDYSNRQNGLASGRDGTSGLGAAPAFPENVPVPWPVLWRFLWGASMGALMGY